MKPLQGLKVIDLTSALSGPFCTMMLADYGAEVIKVEGLGGDQTRDWGPMEEKSGESAYFACFNRDKKGVTLNLKSEKGVELFYEMVKDADILVENYKAGVTKKLGIDYESVKKVNPQIIYASGTGFGSYGPISNRPCYDIVAQAMGGIMNLTGYPDADPVKVGPSIVDHLMGIYLTVGVLLALHHKDVTGQGQFVDVAMLDSVFSVLENAIVNYTVGGEIPQREGNIDPAITPFDVYKCKDGMVSLGCGNNNLFTKFCNKSGLTHLLDDPRYESNWSRTCNYVPELRDTIREWCAQHTKSEIELMMDEAGVPCGPVLNVKEAIEHPQIKARDMIVTSHHPVMGDLQIQGCVVKLSETPGSVDMPAPMLGQHNCEVFGITEEEEAKLIEEGILSSYKTAK